MCGIHPGEGGHRRAPRPEGRVGRPSVLPHASGAGKVGGDLRGLRREVERGAGLPGRAPDGCNGGRATPRAVHPGTGHDHRLLPEEVRGGGRVSLLHPPGHEPRAPGPGKSHQVPGGERISCPLRAEIPGATDPGGSSRLDQGGNGGDDPGRIRAAGEGMAVITGSEPFGLWVVTVSWQEDQVYRVHFGRTGPAGPVHPLLRRYLRGKEVDLADLRSPAEVGDGEVATYGEIARRVGTSPRAVGQVMARNPTPLVIPCHRIVSKNGLGGFTPPLEIKRDLLAMERSARLGRSGTRR